MRPALYSRGWWVESFAGASLCYCQHCCHAQRNRRTGKQEQVKEKGGEDDRQEESTKKNNNPKCHSWTVAWRVWSQNSDSEFWHKKNKTKMPTWAEEWNMLKHIYLLLIKVLVLKLLLLWATTAVICKRLCCEQMIYCTNRYLLEDLVRRQAHKASRINWSWHGGTQKCRQAGSKAEWRWSSGVHWLSEGQGQKYSALSPLKTAL